MYLLNIVKRQVQTGEKGIRTPEMFWSRTIGLSRDLPLYSENSEKAVLIFSYHHNMSRAMSTFCLLIFTGNADTSRILLERTGILLAYIDILFPKCYVWFLFGNPVQNAMCLLAAQADWEPQCSGQIQLLRGFVHWRQRQTFTSEERWCKAVSCT